MLRNVLVALSAAALLLAGAELARGLHRGAPWLILGAYAILVLLALVLERPRYRGAADDATGQWSPTGERFIDPASGEMTEVYEKSETGERQYRRAASARP